MGLAGFQDDQSLWDPVRSNRHWKIAVLRLVPNWITLLNHLEFSVKPKECWSL